MAHLDVHRNTRPNRRIIPFVVDIQSNLLDYLSTRVVVPLRPEGSIVRGGRLNPLFEIEGHRVVMATAEIAAVRVLDLGEIVTSLDAHRDDIIAALDVLWTGV
jgi:toxin CcdB